MGRSPRRLESLGSSKNETHFDARDQKRLLSRFSPIGRKIKYVHAARVCRGALVRKTIIAWDQMPLTFSVGNMPVILRNWNGGFLFRGY